MLNIKKLIPFAMISRAEKQMHEISSDFDSSLSAKTESNHEEGQSTETREQWPEDIERLAATTESLDRTQHEVGELMVSGQQDVAAIDQAMGLTPDEAAATHEETGVLHQLSALQDDARETLVKIAHYAGKTVRRPIAYGEVFDSTEALKELRAAPRAERKQMLRELKDKMSYQQVGLGKMREDMSDLQQQQGTVDLPKMRGIADEYSVKYGFDEFTREIIDDTLDKVDKRSTALAQAAEQYPTGESFFRAMTQGQSPRGEVEITYTPVTAYLRCHDTMDYAVLYYGGGKTVDSMDDHELSVANLSGGCALYGAPIPGLEDAVTVENTSGHDKAESQRVFVHEQQHALHRMMPELKRLDRDFITRPCPFRLMGDSELRMTLRRELRVKRADGEARAKDEIMAYLKDGRPSDVIYQTLLKPKEEGGLYDYFQEFQNDASEAYADELPEDRRPIVEEAMHDVFSTEYAQMLADALRAVETLRTQNGMSVEQTIGTLSHEPLRDWPKISGRIHQEESWRFFISEVDGIQRQVSRLKRRWDVFRDKS
jgi:hypothetical protein